MKHLMKHYTTVIAMAIACIAMNNRAYGAADNTLFGAKHTYSSSVVNKFNRHIKNARVLREETRTDKDGKCEITVPYNTHVGVSCKGYYYDFATLRSDKCQIFRLVAKNEDPVLPEQTTFAGYTNPYYIINGKYKEYFDPDNYDPSQLTFVRATDQWDRDVAKALSNAMPAPGMLAKRGVVFLTVDENIKYANYQLPNKYIIYVYDSKGNPIEDAIVYVERLRTSSIDGSFKLRAAEGQSLLIKRMGYATRQITLGKKTDLPALKLKFEPSNIRYASLPKFRGGGRKQFYNWIWYNRPCLVGPDGVVKVAFTINKDGWVTEPHILETISQKASEEILRLVKSSPRWEPATNAKGEPVSYQYIIAIVKQLYYYDESRDQVRARTNEGESWLQE